MSKHNVEAISFLIGSFKDVVNSFGQNNKAVEFYKRQAKGLINIGQISSEDYIIVLELIGMKNTDAVKWEIAINRLEKFNDIMNTIIGFQMAGGGDAKVAAKTVLEEFKKKGKTDNIIEATIKKIYELDNKESKATEYVNKVVSNISKTDKMNKDLIKRTVDKIGKTDKELSCAEYKEKRKKEAVQLLNELKTSGLINTKCEMQVKNSEAFCSCDPSYFKTTLDGAFEYISLVRELCKVGCSFKFGKDMIERDDPCRPSRTFVELSETVVEKLEHFVYTTDWNKVYEALKQEKGH